MKKIIPFLVLAIAAAAGAYVVKAQKSDGLIKPGPETVTICFPDNCVESEIAITDKQRREGLMFRKFLPENAGMLFTYPEDGYSSFWMKNTLIPLDIIWINSDFDVVHIERAGTCEIEECIVYTTPEPAQYVLETNRGYSEQHEITPGTPVKMGVYNIAPIKNLLEKNPELLY